VVLPQPLTLPAEALARLVALENLGDPHMTLKPTPIWRPRQAEQEAEARTGAELAAMGLIDHRGRRATEAGVGTRPASPQVRLAQRIAGARTTGGGQLRVTVRDRLGRRRASEHPLRYADTANGRWVNLTTPAAGGDNRIVIAPASRRDLVARLEESHRALLR
jgi:hypothetical protein